MSLELDHANHSGISFAAVGQELRATVTDVGALVETVAGGAGFVDVSGPVELNLLTGRAFHHKAVGNMTGPTFSNVPAQDEFSAAWTWVVWQDAEGGRTLSDEPTVRWVDGATFADLNTAADAVTIFTFWRVGAITYGALVTNEILRLDAYRLSFAGNGVQLVVAERAETVLLGSVTNLEADGTAGTGTLTYKRGRAGSVAVVSGDTALEPNDVLEVTMASATTPSAVAIPRVL